MIKKYFNITLSRDAIAQAYSQDESYNSMCFLIGPVSNDLPKGFRITEAKLDTNGHLKIRYTNRTPYQVRFYIEDGELFVEFKEGGIIMALVDLGNVVGPQGPQGIQGVKGDDGISPTFVLGDGTGGTTAGHLYADYDNPYVPNT